MVGSSLDVADESSLREADRQLALLADVCLDEDKEVPAWVIAARRAIAQVRQEGEYE